ncbi:MAG: hypothetical protein QNJ88_08560 [Acidimicrobiia bacterium]|nr:hypothetical protein [Acidimicrobiia bacterium]
MPAVRTEISEIVTGLGMLGFPDIERALAVRPRSFLNVGPAEYDVLDAAWTDGGHEDLFDKAWTNGVTFAESTDGLRGRPPWSLEWKGNHRPPGYEQIPADLRVDHVYLVSCKYGSNILTNSSPANLFVRLLGDRIDDGSDWFAAVAPESYQSFYERCRQEVGGNLPASVDDLTADDRHRLRSELPRRLGGELGNAYRDFSHRVATTSASEWMAAIGTKRQQEAMLWRLLRLQAAPYFVLGEAADHSAIRYRVATPWDFRIRYQFLGFDAWGDETAQQPVVRWAARARDRESDMSVEVEGHVEVRWSHGRFNHAPEAKVYLDTPHHEVPGYFPLDHTPSVPSGTLRLWDDAP